jgi:hypothetical protein
MTAEQKKAAEMANALDWLRSIMILLMTLMTAYPLVVVPLLLSRISIRVVVACFQVRWIGFVSRIKSPYQQLTKKIRTIMIEHLLASRKRTRGKRLLMIWPRLLTGCVMVSSPVDGAVDGEEFKSVGIGTRLDALKRCSIGRQCTGFLYLF